MEYFLEEYALYLNDIGFGVKPLDLNENYSHVIPSSGYTPKISVQARGEDNDRSRDGENDGDGEDGEEGGNGGDGRVSRNIGDGGTGDDDLGNDEDDRMDTDNDDNDAPLKPPVTPRKQRP